MKKIVLFVAAFLVAGLIQTSSAEAKKYLSVGRITGSGVGEHQISTVKNLIRNEIDAHQNARLVNDRPDIEISGSINRLEHSYVLALTGTLTSGKTRARRTKVLTFDEIDIAVKRLVAAIIENKSLESTAERGVILEKEQRETTRVKSIAGWEFAIGAGWPFSNSLNSHKTMYSFALGYLWDIEQFLVEIRGDFQIGYNESDMNATSLSLGTQYVWADMRRAALYSGIDFGFANVQDTLFNGKSGFGIGLNTGVILLRHADINLDLRFRTMMLANKFNEEVPVIGSLMVGLRW